MSSEQNIPIENIVAAVKARQPWRDYKYLIYFFFRRWPVTIFTIVYLWAISWPAWLITILVGAVAFLDSRFVPQNSDVRETLDEVIVYVLGRKEVPASTKQSPYLLKISIGVFVLSALSLYAFDSVLIYSLLAGSASVIFLGWFFYKLSIGKRDFFSIKKDQFGHELEEKILDPDIVAKHVTTSLWSGFIDTPVFYVPVFLTLSFAVIYTHSSIFKHGIFEPIYIAPLFMFDMMLAASCVSYFSHKYKSVARALKKFNFTEPQKTVTVGCV